MKAILLLLAIYLGAISFRGFFIGWASSAAFLAAQATTDAQERTIHFLLEINGGIHFLVGTLALIGAVFFLYLISITPLRKVPG
jgi:hypothetical protein